MCSLLAINYIDRRLHFITQLASNLSLYTKVRPSTKYKSFQFRTFCRFISFPSFTSQDFYLQNITFICFTLEVTLLHHCQNIFASTFNASIQPNLTKLNLNQLNKKVNVEIDNFTNKITIDFESTFIAFILTLSLSIILGYTIAFPTKKTNSNFVRINKKKSSTDIVNFKSI